MRSSAASLASITPLARNEWICWVTSAKKEERITVDDLEQTRLLFAQEIQRLGKIKSSGLVAGLATVPREAFMGPGPWKIARALQVQVGDRAAVPIYAESEKQFFYKVVDAQITFVTDASGSTTNLVFTQQGRDISARRLREA
jgi:hypothetical protein